MSVKLPTEQYLDLLSLKGGCTGSSEPKLVKIPHCWKSHVTAQILLFHVFIDGALREGVVKISLSKRQSK